MNIIAFGHRRRVGKDTAAKLLDSYLRLNGVKSVKLSFAAKLKEVCYSMFGWGGLQPGIFYEDEKNEHLKEVTLPEIGLSPRDIYIQVGNKMREVYADVWIDCALRTARPAGVLIITDLRFHNEMDKVHALRGIAVKITREGVAISDDVSDNALANYEGWDYVIANDFDIKTLNTLITEWGQGVVDGTLWK